MQTYVSRKRHVHIFSTKTWSSILTKSYTDPLHQTVSVTSRDSCSCMISRIHLTRLQIMHLLCLSHNASDQSRANWGTTGSYRFGLGVTTSTREATVHLKTMAAPKEVSIYAAIAVSYIRTRVYFLIERRTKNNTERCFHSSTSFGKNLIYQLALLLSIKRKGLLIWLVEANLWQTDGSSNLPSSFFFKLPVPFHTVSINKFLHGSV